MVFWKMKICTIAILAFTLGSHTRAGIRTCEGLQVCCSLPSNGQGPARTTPPPLPWNPGPAPTQPGAPALPAIARLQGCGVRRFPPDQQSFDQNALRISGVEGVSEETFYGEAPWMARIILNGDFICGGTLINKQVVLTAAHCFNDPLLVGDVSVEVGEWDTSSTREPQTPQVQVPVNIVSHPNFNRKNLQNDVALIFFRTPFTISETVDTVCTPDNFNEVDTNACLAVGWGKREIGARYPLQPVLRKVFMPLMDRSVCQAQLRTTRLSQHFTLLPGFICAGGYQDGDTCKGDGGGPLYCQMKNEPNRMAIVGVISWGIDCGKGNPGVFASVPDYMQWISQQLNSDKWYK